MQRANKIKDKLSYLIENTGDNYTSYQLSAEDLPSIQQHYINKFNIKIILNGDTEFGQQCIANLQQKNQQAHAQFLITPYACYLLKYWLDDVISLHSAPAALKYYYIVNYISSHFYEYFAMLLTYIPAHFFKEENRLRRDLTANELIELDLCIRNCGNGPLIKLFNKFIARHKYQQLEAMNDVGLSFSEVQEEVLMVQKQLQQTHSAESIGYIFTNGYRQKRGHFEALIIAADKIILPIHWGYEARGFFPLSHSNQHAKFMVHYVHSTYMAQAGRFECGTLSILYLKELLKNNSEQLKRYSLSFECTGVTTEKFWFPSPHVLRFSQSRLFNKCLVAQLADQDMVKIVHNGMTYEVKTLRKILSDAPSQENAAILLELDNFRKRWLTEWQHVETQHQNMQVNIQANSHNTYLSYRTSTIKQHIIQSPETVPIARDPAVDSDLDQDSDDSLIESSHHLDYNYDALVRQLQNLLKKYENNCQLELAIKQTQWQGPLMFRFFHTVYGVEEKLAAVQALLKFISGDAAVELKPHIPVLLDGVLGMQLRVIARSNNFIVKGSAWEMLQSLQEAVAARQKRL